MRQSKITKPRLMIERLKQIYIEDCPCWICQWYRSISFNSIDDRLSTMDRAVIVKQQKQKEK